MLSDTHLHIANGTISAGISSDDSITAVISFIKKHFIEFAEINKQVIAINEKSLNQKLCIFLNLKVKAEPFIFHHEFLENLSSGVSPSVDIGTIAKGGNIEALGRQYGENDSFFSIEAKRLPTEGSNREKEYVIGYNKASGAMERFKKGIHGRRVTVAAIIGYVQDKNFEHWFLKINSWISELANDISQHLWTAEDALQKGDKNHHFHESFSLNTREVDGQVMDSIKLFHFWINLLPEKKTQ